MEQPNVCWKCKTKLIASITVYRTTFRSCSLDICAGHLDRYQRLPRYKWNMTQTNRTMYGSGKDNRHIIISSVSVPTSLFLSKKMDSQCTLGWANEIEMGKVLVKRKGDQRILPRGGHWGHCQGQKATLNCASTHCHPVLENVLASVAGSSCLLLRCSPAPQLCLIQHAQLFE